MKQERDETIVPGSAAEKTYRLIRISSPGKKTGRQRIGRAAPAVVQADEQAAGKQSRQEDSLKERRFRMPEKIRQKAEENGRPPVPDSPGVPVPAGSPIAAGCTTEQPAPDSPGVPVPAISPIAAGCTSEQSPPDSPGVPVPAGSPIAAGCSTEQPAPDTAGGPP